jgi:CheY-like chemotaxis protein
VVEDDDALQTVAEGALTDGGFEVAIASSGEEAITLLKGQKDKYRVLVIDISLRGNIQGWDVGRYARETDPEFLLSI